MLGEHKTKLLFLAMAVMLVIYRLYPELECIAWRFLICA